MERRFPDKNQYDSNRTGDEESSPRYEPESVESQPESDEQEDRSDQEFLDEDLEEEIVEEAESAIDDIFGRKEKFTDKIDDVEDMVEEGGEDMKDEKDELDRVRSNVEETSQQAQEKVLSVESRSELFEKLTFNENEEITQLDKGISPQMANDILNEYEARLPDINFDEFKDEIEQIVQEYLGEHLEETDKDTEQKIIEEIADDIIDMMQSVTEDSEIAMDIDESDIIETEEIEETDAQQEIIEKIRNINDLQLLRQTKSDFEKGNIDSYPVSDENLESEQIIKEVEEQIKLEQKVRQIAEKEVKLDNATESSEEEEDTWREINNLEEKLYEKYSKDEESFEEFFDRKELGAKIEDRKQVIKEEERKPLEERQQRIKEITKNEIEKGNYDTNDIIARIHEEADETSLEDFRQNEIVHLVNEAKQEKEEELLREKALDLKENSYGVYEVGEENGLKLREDKIDKLSRDQVKEVVAHINELTEEMDANSEKINEFEKHKKQLLEHAIQKEVKEIKTNQLAEESEEDEGALINKINNRINKNYPDLMASLSDKELQSIINKANNEVEVKFEDVNLRDLKLDIKEYTPSTKDGSGAEYLAENLPQETPQQEIIKIYKALDDKVSNLRKKTELLLEPSARREQIQGIIADNLGSLDNITEVTQKVVEALEQDLYDTWDMKQELEAFEEIAEEVPLDEKGKKMYLKYILQEKYEDSPLKDAKGEADQGKFVRGITNSLDDITGEELAEEVEILREISREEVDSEAETLFEFQDQDRKEWLEKGFDAIHNKLARLSINTEANLKQLDEEDMKLDLLQKAVTGNLDEKEKEQLKNLEPEEYIDLVPLKDEKEFEQGFEEHLEDAKQDWENLLNKKEKLKGGINDLLKSDTLFKKGVDLIQNRATEIKFSGDNSKEFDPDNPTKGLEIINFEEVLDSILDKYEFDNKKRDLDRITGGSLSVEKQEEVLLETLENDDIKDDLKDLFKYEKSLKDLRRVTATTKSTGKGKLNKERQKLSKKIKDTGSSPMT